LANKLGCQGRERVERDFSWQARSEQVNNLLQ